MKTITHPSRTHRLETAMPTDKQAPRWIRQQLAEKLHALAQDMRDLASDIQRPQTSVLAAFRWQLNVSSYVRDASQLLAGELPNSACAVAKASEMMSSADVLREWSLHPTDATGNKARAAQITGVAASIDDFAERRL